MLNSIHTFTKGFAAKLLLILLVLSFGVWGVGDMVQSSGSNQEFATVGDVDISAADFKRSLEREKEKMQRALGTQYTPQLLKSMRLPEQVMQQLVQRSLLLQEAQALGIRPADSDIAHIIQSNTMFHDPQGHFDKVVFNGYLKNSGMNERMYVEQLRNQLALQMIMSTISGHALVHDEAVKALFLSRSQQRNFDLYLMDTSLTQSPAPKEEEIKAYYEANEALFSAPEYRNLSYVRFTSGDAKDVKISPQDVEAAYKERLDEFRQEERRTVEQLLFTGEDKAKKAYDMAKGGASFSEIATSLDAVNKQSLSLGSITRDGLFDEAADSVFLLKEKEVSEPVNSPFGWHVFHVVSITPPGVKPLEEVREHLEKDLKQSRVDEATNRLANDLEDALAGGTPLAETANSLGLALHTLPPVNAKGFSPHNVKVQIPALDGFLDTAFSLEEKTESSLRFSGDGAYYIVHVDKLTPARVRPLEEVKPQVIAAWKNDQRLQKLESLAKKMGKELADAKTRASVAAQNDLRVVTASSVTRGAEKIAGYKLPSIMIADMFVRGRGEITRPYQLEDGAYAIAAVSGIKQASIVKDDMKQKHAIAELSEQQLGESRQELADQYLNYLQQKYPVDINQSLLSTAMQEE